VVNHVALRPVYAWDCDICGREFFERGVVVEIDDDGLERLKNEHGIEVWEEGNFMMMPDTVCCPFCDVSFPTKHYRDDQGDD
jgi:hypothetical protein